MSEEKRKITGEMTKTVDKLIQSNFENATQSEIETYAEWVKIHALNDDEFKQRQAIREQNAQANRDANERQAQAAIEALNALRDLALARLEAVKNG